MSNSLNSTNGFLWTLDDMSDSHLDRLSSAHKLCLKYLHWSSYDAVLKHAEQIIRQEPEKPDGYVFKVRALYLMGQYVKAEEMLLKVIKMAEQNQLIDNNIEAFVKLKYELAAIRKKILIALGVNNFMDVLKRHLLDFNSSIVELNSYTESHTHSSPKCSSNTKSIKCEAIDQTMVTISQTEYSRLKESDKRILELKEKVNGLEQEPRKLYRKLISITKAKKLDEKKIKQLYIELDRLADTVRYVEQKQDPFENRYFFKNNPMNYKLDNKSKNKPKEDQQKMISIRNVVTEVKSEPQPTTNQNNIRHIFHNNKSVPKVD